MAHPCRRPGLFPSQTSTDSALSQLVGLPGPSLGRTSWHPQMVLFQPVWLPPLLLLGRPEVTAPWMEGRAGHLTGESVRSSGLGPVYAGPFTCLTDCPVCMFFK